MRQHHPANATHGHAKASPNWIVSVWEGHLLNIPSWKLEIPQLFVEPGGGALAYGFRSIAYNQPPATLIFYHYQQCNIVLDGFMIFSQHHCNWLATSTQNEPVSLNMF